MRIRQLTSTGAPQAWALDAIPTIGLTADPDVPLDLPVPPEPPAALPDMAVIPRALLQSWCSELADRGATHLAVLTSERSPTYDVVTELAEQIEPFDFWAFDVTEPHALIEGGFYVDPIYF